MTPEHGCTTSDDTNPRVRVRMNEVMRHARRTTSSALGSAPFDLDGSLPGSAPWTVQVDDRRRPLWSPASWFATLAVAGAVPLVIVYWMLH
ncbi:MAG: hypothetical protein AAF602_24980 [Myxococcota bacterium]